MSYWEQDDMGCLTIVPLTVAVVAVGVGMGTLWAVLTGLAAAMVTSVTAFVAFVLILI